MRISVLYMRMFVYPLLVLGFLTICTHCQLTWQEIASPVLLPDSRRDAGLGFDATRNQLILFGGRPGTKDDTWIFDISSGVWRSVNTPTHPAARFSFVSGVQGDYFYVATGEGPDRQFYNDIWRFNLASETWEELPDQPSTTIPEARYGAAGGIHSQGASLFVHQGFSSRRYFDTFSYNVLSQSWTAEFCEGSGCNPYNPSYPHARCLHAGAMAAPNQLVIFGGCMSGGLTGGPCPSGDSWIYSSETKSWTRIDGCPTPRIYGTMAALPSSGADRRLVLYGGVEENRQVLATSVSEADDVSILDPDGLVWYRQKATYLTSAPSLRASASMATATTGVYMFGGILSESGDVTNDLWFLSGTAADTMAARELPCTKHFANWILLHGIFMTLAWGGLLTWGALIARYFNGKGKLWFLFHVSFQVTGLVLATIGTVFAVLSVQSKHFMFAHGIIGLVVMLLGLLQPLNACFRGQRPEEGQPGTLRRKIWEFVHHFSGRIAVVLALINISLGVFFAVVQTPVWALWYTYFVVLLVLVVIAEIRRGLTKQAGLHPQIGPSNNTPPEANYQVQNDEVHESTEKTDYKNPSYDSEIPVKQE